MRFFHRKLSYYFFSVFVNSPPPKPEVILTNFFACADYQPCLLMKIYPDFSEITQIKMCLCIARVLLSFIRKSYPFIFCGVIVDQFIYSWLSLSRTRLTRISGWVEFLSKSRTSLCINIYNLTPVESKLSNQKSIKLW
jgi:hypothetical protein